MSLDIPDGFWVEYEIGPHTLAIGKEPFLQPSGDGPHVALEVDDFDQTIAQLRRHNVPFAHEPFDLPGCRAAIIVDPDGNKLGIHQRKRKLAQAMTFESMSEDEILQVANPIMDNLMDASTAIDHERHIRDFTDRMKAIVTKEYLQKVCEKYQREKGYFSKREAVAVFKRPGTAAIVWKQWFTNAPGEFVAEMLLVEKDGRFLVDHAMVF
jgi:hypothetical protein